jgi:hypothetical protein
VKSAPDNNRWTQDLWKSRNQIGDVLYAQSNCGEPRLSDAAARRHAPGDTVLVRAAAVGMGLLLVQWAKHLARVIGTISLENRSGETGLRSLRFLASRPLTQTFRSYVEQRNNENPENRRSNHAAEHRGTHRLARDGPGPLRNNQGQQS